jgi:hypothetical protein
MVDPLNHKLFLWDPESKLVCHRDIEWDNYDEMMTELCGEPMMACVVDEEKVTMIMLGGYDTKEA